MRHFGNLVAISLPTLATPHQECIKCDFLEFPAPQGLLADRLLALAAGGFAVELPAAEAAALAPLASILAAPGMHAASGGRTFWWVFVDEGLREKARRARGTRHCSLRKQ